MWNIGEIHPLFGEVVACGCGNVGPWRMMSKNHTTSLMPLDVLIRMDEISEELYPEEEER